MRVFLVNLLSASLLSACFLTIAGCGQKQQEIEHKSLDSSLRVGFIDKYFGTPNWGSFVSEPDGDKFVMPVKVKEENARIFFYRPMNRWGLLEALAPKMYINGRPLFGLKAGGYTWAELPPGDYEVSARRPLAFVQIFQIFEIPLTIEAGKDYYFRYSEEEPLNTNKIEASDIYEEGEHVQLLPERIARYEITSTRYYTPGLYLGDDDDLD